MKFKSTKDFAKLYLRKGCFNYVKEKKEKYKQG